MKDKTMAYLMWISLGLICTGLGITIIMAIFRLAEADPAGKKPTVPTSMIQQIPTEQTSLGRTFYV